MVTGRPSITLKIASKSPRCMGSNLASAASRSASASARIIWRTATMRSASKNMCSVRHSPMPSAPNLRAVAASSGVSALVRTFSVRMESAQPISVPKSPVSSGWRIATLPLNTWPVPPSMVMISPRVMITGRRRQRALGRVDLDHAGAGDAGPAHAARHHGGMAGHAAARRQDALGRMHAVNVFGAGLVAHQDDGAAFGGQLLGFVGGEGDLAGGRARRGRQARRRWHASRPWDRAWDAEAGRARRDRRGPPPVSLSISPSRTMSTAIFSAASAVRLPLRVCSMKSLPSCTVNSTSCMSR